MAIHHRQTRSGTGALLLLCAFLLSAIPARGDEALLSAELLVRSSQENHSVQAELALDRTSWARGLMGRETLDPGTGMLFLYHMDRSPAIWMKNVPIPLDVVFLAADGTVVAIYPDRPPRTTQTVSPPRPVRATLELPGGTTHAWGLKPGDRVTPSPGELGREYR